MSAAALSAVASPRRRQILRLIWGREVSAGDLALQFDVSWPAISQHLATLKAAGLVRERREGRHRYYSADSSSVGPLADILEEMWSNDLDRLAAMAEEDEQNE